MEADAANVGESIADVAEQCIEALKKCQESPSLNEDDWAEETLTKFRFWTSTLSVFGDENVSLDAKLALQRDNKIVFVNLLKTLLNCIQECQKSAEEEIEHDGADIARSEEQQDCSPTDDADVKDPPARPFSPWSDDSNRSPTDDPDVTGPPARPFSPWSDDSDLSSSESGDEDDSKQASDHRMSPLDSAKSDLDGLLRHLNTLAQVWAKVLN
ncbi:hypothetical protein MGU_08535 [Metarhizium guizhouense ARSEF 977]|uniref:Uncharacterized protein n=1 Tax=Metarhizium guizhouense (strain ARSEF 977) TaxID=1276136 RepID=A0A0B4GX01_METGA|nr:hypothetical protein MGU_08535 [Metarhizium guizhouense ARSEF 977]